MFLSLLIFLPLVFAVFMILVPVEKWSSRLAITMGVFHFCLSLFLLKFYDPTVPHLQLVEKVSWVSSFGISYFVGLDGISLGLILLTNLLMPLIILSSWDEVVDRQRGFYCALFVLQTTILGTLLSMDAILFYTFFELSLLPMFFIIGIWGGSHRIYASLKFFIYTMLGSVFMLLGILALMLMTEQVLDGKVSTSLLDFYKIKLPFVAGDFLSTQSLLFFAFSFAFAIKIPVFPFHTWLPDAHVEAPTSGSVILAGVMLKMGGYGFLRFVIPLFPDAAQYWSWVFLFLGCVGILYGGIIALVQSDIKKLVAYSSVSHMGFVFMGLFALNQYGLSGALFQMLSHGVTTSALFLLVGLLYKKLKSREIIDVSGVAHFAPIVTIVFIIITFASIAVPLTSGFIGEYLILLGVFKSSYKFTFFAVAGVVLGATYMLWLVKRVFYGEPSERVKNVKKLDFTLREFVTVAPLVILVFWMGVFPNHFLNLSRESVNHLIQNKNNYFLQNHQK